ncbi:shufflon system plasmid conjugative transfer pilus tip adhesin PilV, partial [Chromobacterium vaccinii]|uniref:shufflon system plasmid conjugative transfer pilus tip adhesin PilV n=1 Tax=Chromobacterium vaccinii TaxID=1108595 RepID=UPI003C77EC37
MRRKQAGEMLIGLAIAVAMIGMGLAYLGIRQVNEWRVNRGQILGNALSDLGKGVQSYVVQNHDKLVSIIVGQGGAIANVSNPLSPSAAEIAASTGMRGLGTVPPLAGASYRIVISGDDPSQAGRQCSASTPGTCNVISLTYVDTPLRTPFPGAANAVDYVAAGAAVQQIGTDGGASMPPNTTQFTFQTGNNTALPIANPVGGTPGGIVAVRGGYNRSDMNVFLRLDGSKKMLGTLDMGGKNIVNGLDINGAGSLTMNGEVAAGGNVRAGLDVRASRDLSASGNMSIAQNGTVNGRLGVGTDPAAPGEKGRLAVAGRIRTSEYLQVDGQAYETGACDQNGLIGRDANGLILSCQSG